MFELSGVNYEEVLEQGDSILVRVIASSSYRGFELSGLYCIIKQTGLKLVYSAKQRKALELLAIVEEKCPIAQRDGLSMGEALTPLTNTFG